MSYLSIEAAKAEAAVGLEGEHAEFFSQGNGLAVVVFGWLDLWGITMCGDRTKETQGVCLVPAFLMGTGKIESSPGKVVGLLQATGQQIALAQRGNPQRLAGHKPYGGVLLHGLLQQRQGLSDAPIQGICQAQG
jgi:hypothetical protein